MKRIFFIVLMSMYLFGCSYNETVTTSLDTNTDTTTDTDTNSEIISEQEKTSIIWTEQESKNRIVVEFHDTTEWSRQEQDFLEEQVESWLSEYTEEDIDLLITENVDQQESTKEESYTIELTGETTYRSDSLISVIFQGMIRYQSAAHPNHVFFSINYDPRTMEIVPFEALYTIDAELYQTFAQKGEQNILEECDGEWPENYGEFSEVFCSQEDFMQGLKEDSPQWDRVYYYYTEDGIGFSYSVVHALGGHKEVELLRTDLDPK